MAKRGQVIGKKSAIWKKKQKNKTVIQFVVQKEKKEEMKPQNAALKTISDS